MVKVKDTETFIQAAIAIHGDKYDYSQTVYKSAIDPITIICRTCGPFQLANSESHYRKDKRCGCRRCERNARLVEKGLVFCDCCQCRVNYFKSYKSRCKTCQDRLDDDWSTALSKSLSTLKSKTHRRIADGWKRWVVNKQVVLHNRNIPGYWYSLSKQIGTWDSWCVARTKKLINRKAEDKWKRKLRNWGRSLSQRERKQAASS